jgi:hypothetical protein
MGFRISNFLSALVLAAASTTTSAIVANAQANAQEAPVVFRPRESVPEAFTRGFHRYSGNMLQEKDSVRAIQGYLGTFNFPENAIAKDTREIDSLYRYLMERQVADDPTIRTADLPSPFNLSIQTLPTTRVSRLNGGEFVFERTPETAVPMATPMQPTSAEPMMPQPVQAKF